MSQPLPNWQPLSFLPGLANMIDEMLESAQANYDNLQQVQTRPHILDGQLVTRIVDAYRKQLEDHWLYEEQLRRWQSESLSQAERREIDRLQGNCARLKQTLQAILALMDMVQVDGIDHAAGPGAGNEVGPLSADKLRLAETIDRHVTHVLASGGGNEALLVSMVDDMGPFKQLLDTCTRAEMDELCERYDGFFHFAKLLEHLAQGLADGTIPLPPER